MPSIQNVPVATVRDLRNFLDTVIALHGGDVVPYFWNDCYETEFIPLGQIRDASIQSKLTTDRKFLSLETFDPDPDNERGPVSDMLQP